jgi:hypothetical protein
MEEVSANEIGFPNTSVHQCLESEENIKGAKKFRCLKQCFNHKQRHSSKLWRGLFHRSCPFNFVELLIKQRHTP